MIPQSPQITNKIRSWQAYCYPREAVGDGSVITKVMNFKAWFRSATCPPTSANGAETPVELNVDQGNNKVCITNLFSVSDVIMTHDCQYGAASALRASFALVAAVLGLTVSGLL